MENYKIPAKTGIGHVHLKVSDLKRALEFYWDGHPSLATKYGHQLCNHSNCS